MTMTATQPAPALIIDGKAQADILCEQFAAQVRDELQFQPCLAVVIVGEDPASQVYVSRKVKRATQIGFKSIKHELPATTSEADLLALVEELNKDDTVDGILVQFPLPPHMSQDKVTELIAVEKDVDGFHPDNTVLPPCTPLGCMHLIESVLDVPGLQPETQKEGMTGLNAVVIGRSHHVGKPMAQMLRDAGCTVTVVHSQTEDPAAVCRTADILVAAVGKPHLVKADWVKEGAVVIDVGVNRLESGALVGDVEFEAVSHRARAITPVPGGVGPMTIACLMENTIKAAIARRLGS